MMANLIDEEAVAIILGEEQLDELSNRTVSNALNARIAATGAASDRAYKHRNPQAMRAAETAADKEARMKGAVARRRARMNKEDFESWLDEAMSNYEKNRKRAAQRAAARNEARKQGKTGAVPGVGYVTPKPERETWTDESGKTRHAKGL
jgi:G3E family GTPase